MTTDPHVTTYDLIATDIMLAIHSERDLTLAFDDGSGRSIELVMPVSEFQKLVDTFLEMVKHG